MSDYAGHLGFSSQRLSSSLPSLAASVRANDSALTLTPRRRRPINASAIMTTVGASGGSCARP